MADDWAVINSAGSAFWDVLATDTQVLAEPVSAEAAPRGNGVALASMYYEPLKKIRIDTARRSEPHTVESHTRDRNYTVGASVNRLANDSVANDKHRQAEVDDLFAELELRPARTVEPARSRDLSNTHVSP